MTDPITDLDIAIAKRLSLSTSLQTALGGTPIYNVVAPQKAALPYVVFQQQGGGDVNDTPIRERNLLYSIFGIAETKAQAATISGYIDAALHGREPYTITAAALTSSINTADASVYTTASISPTAGRVQFAVVVGSQSGSLPDPPTVTGAGLTWTLVTSQHYNESGATFSRRVCLYVASGTPSTGALTITFAATQLRAAWAVVEFAGVDTVSPIVQYVSTNLETDTPNFSGLTLGNIAHSSNPVMAMFSTDGTNTVTPESGWTELLDVADDTISLEVAWKSTPDQSITATCSPGNADWGVIAVELRNGGLTLPLTDWRTLWLARERDISFADPDPAGNARWRVGGIYRIVMDKSS